jgi:hypothetical protein
MRRPPKRPKKPPDRAQPPLSGTTIIGKDGRVVHVGDVRIVKLLAELPVLPEMQEQVSAAAAGLTTMIISIAGRDLPKGESTGTRLTLKELAAVEKMSAKLAAQLQLLHKESYDALTARLSEEMSLDVKAIIDGHGFARHRIDYPIEFLRSKLAALSRGAREISVVVANYKMIDAPRGARPKYEAARVTAAAANVFERLTGLRVARRTERNPIGEFHLFLKRVFNIAGMPINVDEQIRGWIANQVPSAPRPQYDDT